METGSGNLFGFIILLLGALGTLYTTINAAVRNNKEQEIKGKIDQKKQEIEEEEKKVEITDRLTKLYDRIIKEMNTKFDELEKEVSDLKRQLNASVKLNRQYEKKIYDLQQAGITLINAFETAFNTREKHISQNPANCVDCNKADEAVLEILSEYKILFQDGNND